MTQRELVNEYFMEQRALVLNLAAFVDRLDRAAELDAADDFRTVALRESLEELRSGDPGRVQRIQMIFSDPNLEPLEELDQKGAKGAFDPQGAEAH